MVQAASLLFLLTEDKILLAMKKRGFGAGRYNGVGGKPESGEPIEQTTRRECQEEIGVTPGPLAPVADLTFYLDSQAHPVDMHVLVYVCRDWQGTPTETDEMTPTWFALADIPYDQMWADDILWLPEVLKGNFVTASFTFDAADQVVSHQLEAKPR